MPVTPTPQRVLDLLLEVEQTLAESLDETQTLIAKVRLARIHLGLILHNTPAAKGGTPQKGDA